MSRMVLLVNHIADNQRSGGEEGWSGGKEHTSLFRCVTSGYDKSESCEVLDVAPDGEAPTNLPRSRIAPYPPPSRLCLFVISKRNGSKTFQRPHYP